MHHTIEGMFSRCGRRCRLGCLSAAVLSITLAGCAPVSQPAKPAAQVSLPNCTAPRASDPLIGNWLSVTAQQGVAGSVRTLYTLQPDGKMIFVEQVKRPRTPSQGLRETGCWTHEGQNLVLRTLESNGSPVNLDDPIYTNRYQVIQSSTNALQLRGASGTVRAKRMSPGYRLPF